MMLEYMFFRTLARSGSGCKHTQSDEKVLLLSPAHCNDAIVDQ